jgi:hypothetical protein
MTNRRIAVILERIADLLQQQGASAHRVRAWHAGARAVRDHDRELADVFGDHGRAGLEALPSIGTHLANVIIELIKTGHSAVLDRLRGDGTQVLEHVPGLGHCLAQRVQRELGIETLEELEAAAHDGRLARVPGFGPRRIAALQDVLATRLRRLPAPPAGIVQPPVELLLAVDREYREAVVARRLPLITPRRFNPDQIAWLPILHVERDGWLMTAVFSNTALAHKLGRTQDWVIIYVHEPGGIESQATVVTERRGPLVGTRVVRGREAECEAYYAAQDRHLRAG